MTDGFALGQLFLWLKDYAHYGPFGIVLILWWCDMRRLHDMETKHEKKVTEILTQHEDYMKETRQMYENNVLLVQNYERIAGELKDIIVMNTQAITMLNTNIEQNRYCPQQQVNKEQIQVAR